MEDTNPEELKNAKEEILKKDAELENSNKLEGSLEEDLENLEHTLDTTESIIGHIEEASDEILEGNENTTSLDKNQGILEALYHRSENFLLRVSKHLAKYPKGVAQSFRDRAIASKALSIERRFEKSKAIRDYYRAYENNNYNNLPPEKDTGNLTEKASRSFDAIYKNLPPLLKKIADSDWGQSKNKERAIRYTNDLLNYLVTRGLSLGKLDEVFDIMKAYEESQPLASGDTANSSFTNMVYQIGRHFGKQEDRPETINTDQISEMLRHDPYSIIEYMDKSTYDSLNLDTNYNFLEKQVDLIIEQHPNSHLCNQKANKLFDKILQFNPEKYALDPQNKKVIFNSFKHSGLDSSNIRHNTIFFQKELLDLPEEDITNTINSISYYDINIEKSGILLASLNLQDNDFEAIFDKFKRKVYSNYEEEKEITYSKELLLEHFEKSKQLFIPFFKYKQFNLDPETRINYLQNIIDTCSRDNRVDFFAQVIGSFDDVFKGIPEEKYDSLMGTLIEKFVGGNIEELKALHAVLPEYNIPLKYREQINQVFAKQYFDVSGNNLTERSRLITESQGSEKFSQQQEWLRGNADIAPLLEIAFYEKGDMNEFRHFFFDVIDGKRESIDKDLLIKKYAKRIYGFEPEEYVDLFLTRKKIPNEYASLFIQKISHNCGEDLLSQTNDALRLGQISEDDHKTMLFDLVENGHHNFAGTFLEVLLGKNNIDSNEKQKSLDFFVTNIVKQASASSNDPYHIISIITDKLESGSITDYQKKQTSIKLFNEMLSYENLHDTIVQISNNNTDGFVDQQDLESLVDKLLISKNADAINRLIDGYIHNAAIEGSEVRNPLFSQITAEKFQSLFEYAMSLESLGTDAVLARAFHNLSMENRKAFLQNILSKEDILLNKYDAKDHSWDFCVYLMRAIEKDRSDAKDTNKERSISEEDAQNIFSKIISNYKLSDRSLDSMILNYSDFLAKNKNILNQYIETITTKDCPATISLNTLDMYKSSEEKILSPEQMKSLSTKVLDSKNIDSDIYQMYIDSKKGQQCFYMDQDMFDKNVQKMIDNKDNFQIESTIDLMILQETLSGEFAQDDKPITFTENQKELIGNKIFKGKPEGSDLEKLYNFDSNLFLKSVDTALSSNGFSAYSFNKLLTTENTISQDRSSEIIKYYFDTFQDQGMFNAICKKYSNDPVSLVQIKDTVSSLETIEDRSLYKSILLRNDLFDQEELRAFYEEIRSEPNIQSQVLLSAEVLGSLVHSDQAEKLDTFFESAGEGVKKNIEFISSFVKKYPLESKGRTIAVMLFSKEYLPELSMVEVIEKVASRLLKYERILEQYEYKGIPAGLNASIGLEYEITHSTAEGYKDVTGRELKNDIVRLSNAAHIGNGRDAVHEIATRPATNPYLMLLEIQCLEDLKYINLNYDYSPLYQKGSRGYHVTIGGESGLSVNSNTNFLQNSILAASWGGIHLGDTGKRVSGGRGVTLRGRSAGDGNNVKVFDKATSSVELRSLSIDKMEPFQRAVVTAFNGAIAIQALEKYTNLTSDAISDFYKPSSGVRSEKDFIEALRQGGYLKQGYDSDEKNMKIIYLWAELASKFKDAVEYHNNEFLMGETIGYLDEKGSWTDTEDFGGEYNRKRFDSVVTSIDPTLSLEEYINSTNVDLNHLFSSFSSGFADTLTRVNNLYLKPNAKAYNKEKDATINLGGDQANAISMLEITKLDDYGIESRTDSTYLTGTVFDTLGERREGYYYVQGGSEKMLTHASQIALLNFNKKVEQIVKN